MKKEKLLSRHYLGTLVTNKPDILFEGELCLEHVLKVLESLNIKVLGEQLHEFPNKSFTLLVGLAESHVSIHTWPERHTVQLDVFLCNYLNDNTQVCEEVYNRITEYFKPVDKDTIIINRP